MTVPAMSLGYPGTTRQPLPARTLTDFRGGKPGFAMNDNRMRLYPGESYELVLKEGTKLPTVSPQLAARAVAFTFVADLSAVLTAPVVAYDIGVSAGDIVARTFFPPQQEIAFVGEDAPDTLYWDPAKWNSSFGSYSDPDFVETGFTWLRDHQIGHTMPYDIMPYLDAADYAAGNYPGWEEITDWSLQSASDSQFETFRLFRDGQSATTAHTETQQIENYWPKAANPHILPEVIPGSTVRPTIIEADAPLPRFSRTGDLTPGTERGPSPKQKPPRPRRSPPVGNLREPGTPPDINLTEPPPSPRPKPRPGPRDPTRPKPPGKGEKERKAKVKFRGKSLAIVRLAGEATEFLDILDAFYGAIPPELRPGMYTLHDKDGNPYLAKRWKPSIAQKVAAVAKHFDELDLLQLVANITRNEMGDRAGGYLGKGLGRANSSQIGSALGFGAGPWDTLAPETLKDLAKQRNKEKWQKRRAAREEYIRRKKAERKRIADERKGIYG